MSMKKEHPHAIFINQMEVWYPHCPGYEIVIAMDILVLGIVEDSFGNLGIGLYYGPEFILGRAGGTTS